MSETTDIADLSRRADSGSVVKTPDGRAFFIHPHDVRVEEVTGPSEDIRQRLTLQTEQSLADYVNRFKSGETVLLADIDANSIVAMLDYHTPVASGEPFGTGVLHQATLTLPYSAEWKAWGEMDGRLVDQLTFARFIEENAADIETPSGADVLEVCRDMQAVRKADFRKVVRTASGTERFDYQEETTARAGQMEVPSRFILRLPVYFGGETVELHAFLRWKLVENSLQLGVKLHRREHVRQAVFQAVVGRIGTATGCPAYFGKA